MRTLSCVILFLALISVRAESCKIFQSKAGGHIFYHIEFTLTSSNSSVAVPQGYRNAQWRPETNSAFREDGMFEVYIRTNDFPIPAPGCNGGWLILRMPATFENDGEAQKKIAAKKAVWERLQEIYRSESGAQKVVIELNPYIRVLDTDEPRVELEECNVFFRSSRGAYVPYVGSPDTTTLAR